MADLLTYRQKGCLAAVSCSGTPELSSVNAIYISYFSFQDFNPLQPPLSCDHIFLAQTYEAFVVLFWRQTDPSAQRNPVMFAHSFT